MTVSFIQSGPLREGAIGRICLRAEGESDQEIRVEVDALDDSATGQPEHTHLTLLILTFLCVH